MKYPTALTALALILAFLVLLPSPAAAQEARSFEQLQLLVKPADNKNGALIGTGVGFGIGLATVVAFCRGWNHCGGDAVAAVAIYTGLGTGIGVGIDALIPARQTIYVGGSQTSVNRLKVGPLVGKSFKGVAVALSF